MFQIQTNIKKCITAIIQHNSVLKNIFDEIHKQHGTVVLVGGAVRDCLLGITNSDLDFEVYHISFEILEKILQKFGSISFVGKSFGVLRLHNLDADWSIPRKDSTGRKPTVDLDPNMSYKDAFKRRDLTINAMGIDVHTLTLIDPYDGLSDLKTKTLRAPDNHFFAQDPLRLFRVMQFIGRFEMVPDISLNQVCKKMHIVHISSERIDAEFEKLFLQSKRPSLGLRWLHQINRFSEIFNTLNYDDRFIEMLDCLTQKNLPDAQKLYCMWGLLTAKDHDVVSCPDIHQPIFHDKAILLKQHIKRYVHSLEIVDSACLIAWYIWYIPLLVKESKNVVAYKWLAYWIDKHINLDLLSIVGSCMFDAQVIDIFRQQAMHANVLYESEKALLQGKDLLQYVQGRELGDWLKYAYDFQLNENISDKNFLLEKILQKKSAL